MRRLSSIPWAVRGALLLLGAWVVGLEVTSILPSHPGAGSLFGDWASEGVQLAAAGLGAARPGGSEAERAWPGR